MQGPNQRPRGSVVTFYSYKGGTGRSMALANTACVLAERERNDPDAVLVVDWDLEAPGLHRFFPPRLRGDTSAMDLGLDDQPGLIDVFIALAAALPEAEPANEEEAERAAAQAIAALPLARYITATEVPGVLLMRAGRDDDGLYSRRVNTFDWEALFRRAPGIYRALAERLAQHSRWVLIDSRTGVTDISGICTSLMPEKLVVVFTPNRQSLTGVRELVSRASAYRLASDDLRPLLVFPLPSRIEASLERLSRQWRYGHPDAGIVGYQPMFEHLLADCYGLARCDLKGYFDTVTLQQTPECAYGELISVRDGSADRLSLAASYRVFVDRLVSGRTPWEVAAAPEAQSAPPAPPVLEALPAAITAPSFADGIDAALGFGITAGTIASDPFADVLSPSVSPPNPAPTGLQARPPPPQPATAAPAAPAGVALRANTSPPPPATAARIFISWAPSDRERVARVAEALIQRGHQVSWDRDLLSSGESYSTVITRALDASDVVLVFWSRTSIESRSVEVEVFEGLRRGVLVPVMTDEVLPPLAFRNLHAFDFIRGDDAALARLVQVVEQTAARQPGEAVALPPAASASAPAAAPAAVGSRVSEATRRLARAPALGSPQAWTWAGIGVAAAVVLYGMWFARPDAQAPGPGPGPGNEIVAQRRADPPALPASIARRLVTVPTVTGLSTAEATTAATAVGLVVRWFDADTSQEYNSVDGLVREQSPAAKTDAPVGSVLRLTVATQTALVPVLSGNSLSDALAVLRASGLALGDIESVEGVGKVPGTVIGQTPQPGARLATGSRVNVSVAAASTGAKNKPKTARKSTKAALAE